MRLCRLVCVIAILVAATVTVGVSTTGTASAIPDATVTPNTGLHDGDVVTVHADGYLPDEAVQILECPAATACRQLKAMHADSTGVVDAQVVAHAFIRTQGGSDPFLQPASCNGACMIAVVGSSSGNSFGGVTFVPNVTILDPPVVLTPPNPVADGQAVGVHVDAGYFDLGQTVHFMQCPIPWNYFSSVSCGFDVTATASATDASVDAAFVVHENIPSQFSRPAVDCRITLCGIVATGIRYDVVDGALVFATPSSTTTTSTVRSTSTSGAPAVAATPRFTA